MSLIPFILDLADELHEFSRCLANGIDINDFGFGLYTGTDHQQPQQHHQQQQQQQQPQTSPRRSRTSSFSSFWMPSKRHHPYTRIKTACCAKSGEEAVTNLEKSDAGPPSVGGTPGKAASYSVVNKNGFQVSMNVKQFAPNELSVKTIDNCIVVEGRHDDKEDGHGVISRHFVRKYMLPKGYDPNDVLSTLSSDGILTVKAPPPPPPAAKSDERNERVIEIQPTPIPAPSPVLVVSAKETPVKETTKNIATSPLSRLDCQLPEKRQKLDLPPEPELKESRETQLKILSEAATANDIDSASTPAAGTEIECNDVEMEKADEQTTENGEQQPTSNLIEIENDDVEKKAELIEQAANLLEREQEKTLEETEKKLLDECMAESNGDSKSVCEKTESSSRLPSAAKATEIINETPADTKNQESVDSATKMDVDGEDEGHIGDEKTDNSEIVADTIKTADCETKTAVTSAANNVSGKNTDVDPEKNNDTDISSSSTTATTTTTTTITTNNNNNSCTNRTNSATDNSAPEVATENSANAVSGGNGVVTGEIPLDNSNSADSAADTTTTNTTKSLAAESVADVKVETETAVLSTDKTASIIDDVALLKAATADPTTITDNTAESVILTESIDGITTTDLSTTATTNTTTNTITTTTVDSVESSLFAKKSHLGNGNNTTATPVVGTEEMAN